MHDCMKTIRIKHIEKAIEVKARLSVVYNQWTQFEQFPDFMRGVKSVVQLDDRHLAWRAKILGHEVGWEAEITEQVPDQHISWRSTSGHPNKGTIYFTSVNTEITKMTLTIEYEAQGLLEKITDALGALSFRIAGDLHSFRKFIEQRGAATGGWRGIIPIPAVIS